MGLRLGAVGVIVAGAIDPTIGTIIVSAFAMVGGIVIAIIQGRNSAERLADKDRIRRLERWVEDHGGDPDDV